MDGQDIILVNDRDEIVGYGEKMDVHRKMLLHRAFSIFIYDRAAGRMLLQRRAYGKYHSGGLWTNACCSHPRRGMSMEACLNERLAKELGLRAALHIADSVTQGPFNIDADALYPCGKFTYAMNQGELGEHEVDHVFLYCPPPEETALLGAGYDPDEIAELRWVGMEVLRAWLRERPEEFTVWFRPALDLAEGVLRRLVG